MKLYSITRQYLFPLGLCVAYLLSGFSAETSAAAEIKIERTNNRSPDFLVSEDDVGFFMNHTGWKNDNDKPAGGERFFHDQIAAKALDMIATAERHIVMSVFLFDSLYADGVPEIDIVGMITKAFIEKKRTHPDIKIALILDPSHKTYARRESESERLLRANGIDIFYSDMLSGLKKASFFGTREGLGHVNRVINTVTFNGWGNLLSAVFSRAKVPVEVDGEYASLEGAYNALLLKANHRKILVTDLPSGEYEALVTSANPHNASAFHVNTGLSVKGATAAYIFNVLRKDIKQSARLGKNFAHWHDSADRNYKKTFLNEQFPELSIDSSSYASPENKGSITATFITEAAIRDAVLKALREVQAGDEVRIQMFYLSFAPVVEAVLEASARTKIPLRILLDSNKDSFNREKDGTPNRQVARHLLQEAQKRGSQIEVRWYSTHGEQNHAKIMAVTNSHTGKYFLMTGSGNWTGRNLDGVNMESNLIVNGSPKLTESFNNWFDLFWSNGDGNEYSLDYEVFKDRTASDQKWKRGEKPYYLSTF